MGLFRLLCLTYHFSLSLSLSLSGTRLNIDSNTALKNRYATKKVSQPKPVFLLSKQGNPFHELCRVSSICKYISAASWATGEACSLALTVLEHRVLRLPVLSGQDPGRFCADLHIS